MQGIRDMGPEVVLSRLSGANHVQACLWQMTIDAIWAGGSFVRWAQLHVPVPAGSFYVITCRKVLAGRICKKEVPIPVYQYLRLTLSSQVW
jgi:hypothetical protein